MWGKTDGRGNINKYEFPPPSDNIVIHGSCLLTGKDKDNNYVNLRLDQWEKAYEYLFGGFEDIGSQSSDEEEDELDDIQEEQKTKTGYLKDDFIASDSDDEANYDDIDGSELSEDEYLFSDEN